MGMEEGSIIILKQKVDSLPAKPFWSWDDEHAGSYMSNVVLSQICITTPEVQ